VNSFILEMLENNPGSICNVTGRPFMLDGSGVMHLTPKGTEGRLYGADEVYDMILEEASRELGDKINEWLKALEDGDDEVGDILIGIGVTDGRITVDIHDVWKNISDESLDDDWDHNIRNAVRSWAGNASGIPAGLERRLQEMVYAPKVDWRTVLHDFIQNDRPDYDFSYPDRRFQGNIILPSFQENVYGDSVKNLWFVVDTSGSVTEQALTKAVHEVRAAMDQIGKMSGSLSYFDEQVSEPVRFDDVDSLMDIKPVGGGGTSFQQIFDSMVMYFEECEFPEVIIILTDGYAPFPDEEAALGIPVLWIMVNSERKAPWGETVHIWD
jgi:predicted metal-dependent peptidase